MGLLGGFRFFTSVVHADFWAYENSKQRCGGSDSNAASVVFYAVWLNALAVCFFSVVPSVVLTSFLSFFSFTTPSSFSDEHQLEIKVERQYVEVLAHRCRQERQQMRYDLYYARTQKNAQQYKRIQNRVNQNCEEYKERTGDF